MGETKKGVRLTSVLFAMRLKRDTGGNVNWKMRGKNYFSLREMIARET